MIEAQLKMYETGEVIFHTIFPDQYLTLEKALENMALFIEEEQLNFLGPVKINVARRIDSTRFKEEICEVAIKRYEDYKIHKGNTTHKY